MLEVLEPGFLTTVQDGGRLGYTDLGVPVGGACDTWSMAVANLLLGNDPSDAVLELTLGGPELLVLRRCAIGLAGADFGAHVVGEGRPIAPGTVHLVQAGSRIGFAGERGGEGEGADVGARAYLAVAGGIDVPPVLGSRGTCLVGVFGGIEGRAVRRGDRLVPRRPDDVSAAGRTWPEAIPLLPPLSPVRLLPPPPTLARSAPRAFEALLASPWRVGRASDRQGLRLEGPALPVDPRTAGLAPSRGVIPGVVQVTAEGSPIVLLADAQTVGGYPVAGVVAAVDRPVLGQLRAGATVRFVATTVAEATVARRAARAALVEAARLMAIVEDWHAVAEDMA